jgi:predicted component of type VI protein secretion system
MLDLEALKKPVAGDSPVGPDLRGEVEFNEVEEAPLNFSGMGPGEFKKLVTKCGSLFAQTKDQIPAIVALEAAARLGDLAEMRAALGLIEHLIADHWDDYHPGPADEMGDARVNELAALKRRAALSLPLSRLLVVRLPGPGDSGFSADMLSMAVKPVAEWTEEDETRLGEMVGKGSATKFEADAQRLMHNRARMLRSICRTVSRTARDTDQGAGVGYEAPEGGDIESVARALLAQAAAIRAPLIDFADAISGIDEALQSRLGMAPGLGAVAGEVSEMARSCEAFVEAFTDPVVDPAQAGAASAEVSSAVPGAVLGGSGGGSRAGKPLSVDSVQSRADVLVAIDAIIRYYRDSEPASPVPVMLRRVRGWIDKDFLALMRDIAPAQSEDLERLLVSPGS